MPRKHPAGPGRKSFQVRSKPIMSSDQSPDSRRLPPTMWDRVKWAALACAVLVVIALVTRNGCERPKKPETPPPAVAETPPVSPTPEAAPPQPETAAPSGETPPAGKQTIVRIVTDKGDITAELFDDKAPITAGNFLLLAESGFYNGLTFHRVEPGFCIQGGDPEGTGGGGPGFTIPDEVSPDLKHDKGVLSMAKTPAPNTAGSQFFVSLGGPERTGHLDMLHAVFGKVIEGLEVAEKIAVGDKMKQVEVVSESPHAAAAKKQAEAARVPDTP